MALFKQGDKVLHRVNHEHGIIVDVGPLMRGGYQLYNVSWSGRMSDEFEEDLVFDADITNPFERCKLQLYDYYADFAKKNTSFKIKNSNNSTISSLTASKTLFRAYQFKPLLKYLNSPNRRLLIADEVGLGKTIEAGHIMLELKARQDLKNVLIVCPKSLQYKWKSELDDKFGLTFTVYDSVNSLINDLQEKDGSVKAIVNYEKIRLKEVYDKPSKKPVYDNNLVEYIQQVQRKFSLVLCDEAHKLRNDNTKTYKGADIIANSADSVLFLTATPIMLNTRNLYNLLHLLDNVSYYNYEIFDNILSENAPFVRAITQLNHNESLVSIADELENSIITTRYDFSDSASETTASKKFAQYPIYQRIIRALRTGPDTPNARALIQYDMSSMSVMNNVFSRTRKREVTTDMSQAERKPNPFVVRLNEKEQKEFDKVIEEYSNDNSYIDMYGEIKIEQGAALGLVQKKRQVASSVYGYLNEESDLDNGVDRYADENDAKFDQLLAIIREVFSHGNRKIVIFGIFRKTLKYLAVRLKKAGLNSLIIHGGVKDRTSILEEFRTNPECQILLSSEVGSEGLDMQFCNSMVNYDLPWNPMVVEQRIGRIDRFGQQSPVVNIYNLIVADSIQVDIYERLLDRIGIFRNTIGDMEAILDARIEVEGRGEISIQELYSLLERELYYSKLTPEERQRKIAEVERAIENEREELKRLESKITNTLTNDAYFREEINRILRNKSYVTEFELKNYLQMVMRELLTTCELIKQGDGIYEFHVPTSDPRALTNFLASHQPIGDEYDIMFNKFRRELESMDKLLVTFNQQVAYENRHVQFLNLYHPIILSCLKYYQEQSDTSQTTFSYAIPARAQLVQGYTYLLAIYQITTIRKIHGVQKIYESLLPLAFDIMGNGIVRNESLVEELFSLSQTEGIERNLSHSDLTSERIDIIRGDFLISLKEKLGAQKKELEMQIENDTLRNRQQLDAWYHARKESIELKIAEDEENRKWALNFNDTKSVKNYEGSIRLRMYDLQEVEKKYAERLNIINEPSELSIKEELISLNFIEII